MTDGPLSGKSGSAPLIVSGCEFEGRTTPGWEASRKILRKSRRAPSYVGQLGPTQHDGRLPENTAFRQHPSSSKASTCQCPGCCGDSMVSYFMPSDLTACATRHGKSKSKKAGAIALSR